MKKQGKLIMVLLLISLVLNIKSSNAMEKKTIEKQTVLMYTMTSTLATLMTDPGNVPMEIMEKASELGLEVLGPQLWQYTGVDGKPDTEFKLEICLPVKEAKGDAGEFKFETLPAITCISETHKGSYSTLKNTYDRMFGEMTRKGIMSSMLGREVYHVYDPENEENNVTEIQIILQEN
jgi:effector-binding domain-containing protein